MSLPFGLTPLPPRPTSFQFYPRSPSPISRSPSPTTSPSNLITNSPSTRSPSPSTSSIRSIRSLQSILDHHHHRRPSTTSVIPSARSSMFGEEVESEDVAVMGVMEPRPDEGGRERWGGIGEVLGGW